MMKLSNISCMMDVSDADHAKETDVVVQFPLVEGIERLIVTSDETGKGLRMRAAPKKKRKKRE